MDICPTVKVKNDAAPDGYMLINESDFVEGTHELFDAPAPADDTADTPAKRAKSKPAE